MHCFGHALNVSVRDAVRSIPLICDVMQNLHNLSTIIIVHGSAKRLADGVETCDAMTPLSSCPTRWTVADTQRSMLFLSHTLYCYRNTVPQWGGMHSNIRQFVEGPRSTKSIRKRPNFAGIECSTLRFRRYWRLKLFTSVCNCATATVCGSIEAVPDAISQLRQLCSDELFSKLWLKHVFDAVMHKGGWSPKWVRTVVY